MSGHPFGFLTERINWLIGCLGVTETMPRKAHNLKVVGSDPAPTVTKNN